MHVKRFLLVVTLSLFLLFAAEVDVWYLKYLSYIQLSFTWLETFFHEVSHGIVATLTGGSVVSLEFKLNGGGRCAYQGGWLKLVYFVGYAGASVWGAVLYLGATASIKNAHRLAISVLVLIVLSGLSWVKFSDHTSWFVLFVISANIVFPLWFVRLKYIQTYVQFLGIYVLLSSARSAIYLIQIKLPGDDTQMASVTKLPEIFWILVWVSISIAILFALLGKAIRSS